MPQTTNSRFLVGLYEYEQNYVTLRVKKRDSGKLDCAN